MPSGSKPGERRGGRQPGTPNKKTALVSAAFAATASDPNMSPLDFFLTLMRDPSVSPDWRFRAAQAAAPFVHAKPASSTSSDPAASAKQIEGPREDLLYAAFEAYGRPDKEECDRIERFRIEKTQKAKTDLELP
jgi:hypothetical protein